MRALTKLPEYLPSLPMAFSPCPLTQSPLRHWAGRCDEYNEMAIEKMTKRRVFMRRLHNDNMKEQNDDVT
jgi:hypothetical protein